MISGGLISSSMIVNSGSMGTTYLGSILSSSGVGTQADSVNTLQSKSSTDMPSDAQQFTVHPFATTLFPVSAIFNSCFMHQNTSADPTKCQSAVLNFGAGMIHTGFFFF